MSQPKSLAESLFEDLLNEAPIKKIEHKNKRKSVTKTKNTRNISENNEIKCNTPDNPVEDPLSDLVIQNLKLLKNIKKCHVRLPKIGQKKLLQMIKKTIKKNNKKNKLNDKKKFNKSNDKNNTSIAPKKTSVRLSRIDLNQKTIISTRKRKSSDSPSQSSKDKNIDSKQQKLFFKISSPRKPITTVPASLSVKPIKKSPASQIKKSKRQQKKNINRNLFLKSNLQDTFGRQFFKCRVRINKFRSLNNLNVTDLAMELEKGEKRKLKKKTKGLNKSVSFVETVEVFGESDSEDNTPDLNKDIIELDASVDENNDRAGGDDGNLIIDVTQIKKLPLNSDDSLENQDVSENIFTGGDDLIVSTPKEKLSVSPGKVRVHKSFSALKSEEQSPRNKLLRKGDEKIVRNLEIILDDVDNDDDDDTEKKEYRKDSNEIDDTKDEITNSVNDSSVISRLDSKENNNHDDDHSEKEDNDIPKEDNDILKEDNDIQIVDNDIQIVDKEKEESQNILKITEQYESLSSDDSKDFLDAKDTKKEFESKTNIDTQKSKVIEITESVDDDEDDDYYLPKPKTSQNYEYTKTNDNEQNDQSGDDDVETIDKIMSSVNEVTMGDNEEKIFNEGEDDNEIFQKVVETIGMLSPSPVQFGDELKLSEDENSHKFSVEKEITTTTTTDTNQSSSPAPNMKFSFNSFLKSSIQTIKTRIMTESPKRLSGDDMTISQATESTKIIQYTPQNDKDIDLETENILLHETDDEETSALLGDPVLGGREMSF